MQGSQFVVVVETAGGSGAAALAAVCHRKPPVLEMGTIGTPPARQARAPTLSGHA